MTDVTEALVVQPETVAKRAGIDWETLDEDDQDIIIDAILDAQADVVAYLGRPITPVERSQSGCWPYPDGWQLDLGAQDDDTFRITAVDAESQAGQPTGYFTVTYITGLDVANDPEFRPITRFVRAHALNSTDVTRLWTRVKGIKGNVKSLSAEGQSVSFDTPNLGVSGQKPGDLTPGSMPTMKSLDYWRLAGRRVHQGESLTSQWPYTGRRW